MNSNTNALTSVTRNTGPRAGGASVLAYHTDAVSAATDHIHPVSQTLLKTLVSGKDLPTFSDGVTLPGQTSNMHFRNVVQVLCEYAYCPEEETIHDMIDFIGKSDDVQLTLVLKSQLGNSEIGTLCLFLPNLYSIDTVHNLARTFRMARMGTIAHLRSRLALI